jgi:hypothetical protein
MNCKLLVIKNYLNELQLKLFLKMIANILVLNAIEMKWCLKWMRRFSNASAIKASIVLWLIFGLQLNTIQLICGQLLMNLKVLTINWLLYLFLCPNVWVVVNVCQCLQRICDSQLIYYFLHNYWEITPNICLICLLTKSKTL